MPIGHPDNRCRNCRYWNPSGSPADIGQCRVGRPEVTASRRGYWPETRSLEWCGEWAAPHDGERPDLVDAEDRRPSWTPMWAIRDER